MQGTEESINLWEDSRQIESHTSARIDRISQKPRYILQMNKENADVCGHFRNWIPSFLEFRFDFEEHLNIFETARSLTPVNSPAYCTSCLEILKNGKCTNINCSAFCGS